MERPVLLVERVEVLGDDAVDELVARAILVAAKAIEVNAVVGRETDERPARPKHGSASFLPAVPALR